MLRGRAGHNVVLFPVFFCALILSAIPATGNSQQLEQSEYMTLNITSGSPSHFIHWERDTTASGITNANIRDIWFDAKGEQGWAVGHIGQSSGHILHYSRQHGWRPEVTVSGLPSGLTALWLDAIGQYGWAIGNKGIILRYNRRDGWHRDVKASTKTDLSLYALWLDAKGEYGWAVGDEGIVLRYNRRDGWHRDENASRETDLSLYALWLDEKGEHGWAVGDKGVVLRYTRKYGWQYDKKASNITNLPLYALWLDSQEEHGWAVGGDRTAGAVLSYGLRDGWQHDAKASSLTSSSMFALWLDEKRERGWAIGDRGKVLQYSRENGWQSNVSASRETNSPLSALWLDSEGTQGWAVGGHGEILQYSRKSGWHRDPSTNGETYAKLNTLWLDAEGEYGWAAGSSGEILRFSQQDGWQRDPSASGTSDSELIALRFDQDGDNGWVVGVNGEILRYNSEIGWRSELDNSNPTGVRLSSVWLDQTGTQGWAIGENGELMRYSQLGGWQYGELINSIETHLSNTPGSDVYVDNYLLALWIDPKGSEGWAMGANGNIIRYNRESGWHYDELPCLVTGANLSSLWLDADGNHGWAVGDGGVILHYNRQKGWQQDKIASSESNKKALRALWLDPEGNDGWAVGDRGIILHFSHESGWRRMADASAATEDNLYALWLDAEGNQGWAVGDRGVVLHYSPEDGWRHDGEASDLARGVSLSALWLDAEGNQGWAVGDRGVILHYDREDGWRFDEQASKEIGTQLFALQLDAEGNHGWAFSSGHEVLRYSRQNGWQYDKDASIATGSDLFAIWLDAEGNHGWAVGRDNEIVRYDRHEGGWKRAPLRGSAPRSCGGKRLSATLSSHANSSLSDLWLDDQGSNGWAVGEKGAILQYSRNNGWQTDTSAGNVIENDFTDVWLDIDGDHGWAIAQGKSTRRQTVLRYHSEDGWRYDKGISSLTRFLNDVGRLNALRLDAAGNYGWAVGSNGNFLHYSIQEGWQHDEDASRVTDVALNDLWLHAESQHGWAVGDRGEIIKGVGSLIEPAKMIPAEYANLARLMGEFRIEFPLQVDGFPVVKIIDKNGNEHLMRDHYEISKIGHSGRIFNLAFLAHATRIASTLPIGRYAFQIQATLVENSLKSTVQFERYLKLKKTSSISVWEYIVGGVLLVVSVIVINAIMTLLAPYSKLVRRVILHPLLVLPLYISKYIFVYALIMLSRPVRIAFFRDYRKHVAAMAPELTRWSNKEIEYIDPVVKINVKADGNQQFKKRDPTKPLWREALDTIISHGENHVWLVNGPSGLGKSALLENWTIASLSLGCTPILIRLRDSETPVHDATATLYSYGDMPLIAARDAGVDKIGNILEAGGFLVLLDSLNEELIQGNTQKFVRRMAKKNIIIIASQYYPQDWDRMGLQAITLEPFDWEQIEKILPEGWFERVWNDEQLKMLARLPASAELLARYIRANNALPSSLLGIYEFLCLPIADKSAFLNLQEMAWQLFCRNEDQFHDSNAIPKEELCEPAKAAGLLSIRQSKEKTLYKFNHDRIHSYLVARYLVRQDRRPLKEWSALTKSSHGWADVLEFWGLMIVEHQSQSEEDVSPYIDFLEESELFGSKSTIFKRLYSQYMRLRDSQKIEADISFERWVADKTPEN